MTRILLIISALLAALSACRKDESVSAYGAAGKNWVLVEMDGKLIMTTATLTFPAPGKIAGQGPCNSFTATLSVPYPWFETGPIAATRMACPDLSAETAFFSAVSQMTLAEVLGNTLILSTQTDRKMVFTSDG